MPTQASLEARNIGQLIVAVDATRAAGDLFKLPALPHLRFLPPAAP